MHARAGLGRGCPSCHPRGWTRLKLREFVASLLPHIDAFSPAELFLIFQQNGIIAKGAPRQEFARALATGNFPKTELEHFASGQPSLADDMLDGALKAIGELGDEQPESSVLSDDLAEPDEKFGDRTDELPLVKTVDALGALDSALITTADAEAIEYLVASAKAKLWNHAFRDPTEAANQAVQFDGGDYAARVRDEFLGELDAANRLEIPNGYSFTVDGSARVPNLMQRLAAIRVRDRFRVGNWSGTGAGKTLGAVLASRVVDSRLTVICCPNSVVEGWSDVITSVFPGTEVATKTWEPSWRQGSVHRYLVVNFENFQQPDSEVRIADFLAKWTPQMVVIDEIHYAKQRDPLRQSRRKRLVAGLIAGSAEANRDVRVLGMSATPVINELSEGKSLIELVTGHEHNDLDMKATVGNAMRLHQRLATLGIRYKHVIDAHLDVRRPLVDCTDSLAEIRAIGRGASPLQLERILTQARMPTLLAALEPKTLIYSYLIDGIDDILGTAIGAAGYSVGFFTGSDKRGLSAFIDGDLDVLIATSAIGTGVDRLQEVCRRLVVNVLPWTHAEWEQLIGRVWRQGQSATEVSVIAPATYATVGGERWSYDDSKWARLQFKKSLADAAVDGVVPEGNLRSAAQAHADLLGWLDRLDHGEAAEIERRLIVVPLSAARPEVERRLRCWGDFSQMNNRWNHTGSVTLHDRLVSDPEEWEHYHTLYREARKTWDVVPYEEAILWLQDRPGRVVADFGCGEAALARAVGNTCTVHSFDHVAIDPSIVTACDMAATPLDDASVDVAVFSLSLMGSNFSDYLREAHRVLRLDGLLHIWEASSRIADAQHFAAQLTELGFERAEANRAGPFLHIVANKSTRQPNPATKITMTAAGFTS